MKYKNNNPEKRIFYKEDELIIEKITQNIGILENKYKIKIDILYNSQSIKFFRDLMNMKQISSVYTIDRFYINTTSKCFIDSQSLNDEISKITKKYTLALNQANTKYYFKKINYEYVRNTIDSNLISKIYKNICHIL